MPEFKTTAITVAKVKTILNWSSIDFLEISDTYIIEDESEHGRTVFMIPFKENKHISGDAFKEITEMFYAFRLRYSRIAALYTGPRSMAYVKLTFIESRFSDVD